MSDTLLPCPFCGHKEPILDEIIGERKKDADRYLIICVECMNQTNTYLYKEDAISAWNKRAKCDHGFPDKIPKLSDYEQEGEVR